MSHSLSSDDRRFCADFARCRFHPDAFDHRTHIRLAYIYLAEYDADTALTLMRNAMLTFIQHHKIDVAKYHETLTRAWPLAVRHFMAISPDADDAESAASFIANNPRILDSTPRCCSPRRHGRVSSSRTWCLIPRHDG
jgi:hypothetical protein